jgi:hypothetical protein
VRRPKISSVLIVYKMAAQTENVIKCMLRDYQLDVMHHGYELIIVENESPEMMRQDFVPGLPDNFNYYLRKYADLAG